MREGKSVKERPVSNKQSKEEERKKRKYISLLLVCVCYRCYIFRWDLCWFCLFVAAKTGPSPFLWLSHHFSHFIVSLLHCTYVCAVVVHIVVSISLSVLNDIDIFRFMFEPVKKRRPAKIYVSLFFSSFNEYT